MNSYHIFIIVTFTSEFVEKNSLRFSSLRELDLTIHLLLLILLSYFPDHRSVLLTLHHPLLFHILQKSPA